MAIFYTRLGLDGELAQREMLSLLGGAKGLAALLGRGQAAADGAGLLSAQIQRLQRGALEVLAQRSLL